MDGDLFVACAEQQLVPAQRPGDGVVMANLACHKKPAIAAVRAAGCGHGNPSDRGQPPVPDHRRGGRIRRALFPRAVGSGCPAQG
ncbi:MAG: hypothetical protein J0I06_17230, partial [Planctomycetes bacterium]|nr:hypothetical protein [Planctomycetota bacterium]